MSRERKTDKTMSESRPALTPEGRENQLIALAVDRAEQQLRDGTASSQVITHFLKLGSTKEKLEKEILERQKDLITAKTEALKAQQRLDALYSDALKALKGYRLEDDEEEECLGPIQS